MASSMPMRDHMSCGVCMEQYNRADHIPKLLPCQHTFCLACLLALESSSFSTSIECPVCRSQHPCSPHDFTTNRAVMDIAEELQEQASRSLSCSVHADKQGALVCVDCLAGICAKCVMIHRDHRVEDLNDAKTLLRERFVEETREQQSVLKTEMTSASSVKEITRAEDDVKKLCTLLISVITKWQNEQLSIIEDIKTKAAKREQEMNEQHAKLEAMLQNDIYISTLIANLRKKDEISCQALQGNSYNFVTARQKILADLTSVITSDNWVNSKFLQDQISKAKLISTSLRQSPQQQPDSQISARACEVRTDNQDNGMAAGAFTFGPVSPTSTSTMSPEKKYRSEDIFVEKDIMAYLRAVNMDEITTICKRHKVEIVCYETDDICVCVFHGKKENVQAATTEMNVLVQNYSMKLTSENVLFRRTAYKEKQRPLDQLEKKHSHEVLFCYNEDRTALYLVGEQSTVRTTREHLEALLGTTRKRGSSLTRRARRLDTEGGSSFVYDRQASITVSLPARSTSSATAKASAASSSAADSSDDKCSICMDPPTKPKTLKCKHTFCTECIDAAFKRLKPACPICGEIYGALTGDLPDGGTMVHRVDYLSSLPGYEKDSTIVIEYRIPSGKQGPSHPNPGKRFTGDNWTAYLPDNTEGRKVLGLLRRAFNARLIFTVGLTVTSSQENMVTWNDIHHKTNRTGGPSKYGYPDPHYLKRVQEELAAKGIK